MEIKFVIQVSCYSFSKSTGPFTLQETSVRLLPHTEKVTRKYLLNGWLRPARAYRKLFQPGRFGGNSPPVLFWRPVVYPISYKWIETLLLPLGSSRSTRERCLWRLCFFPSSFRPRLRNGESGPRDVEGSGWRDKGFTLLFQVYKVAKFKTASLSFLVLGIPTQRRNWLWILWYFSFLRLFFTECLVFRALGLLWVGSTEIWVQILTLPTRWHVT